MRMVSPKRAHSKVAVPVLTPYWAFAGGLDQETPPIRLKPGFCRAASNVEVSIHGGYTRLAGYERYDGQARPSDAQYAILNVTITGAYSLGDTLTGATSGATGVIVAVADDASYFVLTKTALVYQAETLNIGGNPVATCTAAANANAASTPALNATYLNLAADEYRADIAAVPGSGNVLGVWQYDGSLYAFRNNAGGTAAVMHKSTAAGWAAVTLYNEVSFTAGGTATPVDGETLTQAGVTATVKRVVTLTGAWTGTSTGRFIVTNPAGGNFAAGAATLSGGATVTLSGAESAITLAKNGRYEFVNENFGGLAGATKMYACSGVHRAFEFDGTVLVPIHTGMTTDTPEHITAHKKHLFLVYDGSVQHSGIGTPHIWTVVTGAAEIAAGDYCTGLLPQTSGTAVGVLVIYTRNGTNILYGNSSSDWNLAPYAPDSGAIEWTVQFLNQGIVFDDRGVTLMATTQNFGNFANSSISSLVNPYLKAIRETAQASCVVREKNQYRLFSADGAALYVTFIGNKVAGLMPVTLPDSVECICSQEAANGVEEVYFGSDDGVVYQMEKGTSFDGDAIQWSFELAYNHFGSPRELKTFRKAIIEITGDSYCEFNMGYLVSYGSSSVPQGPQTTIETTLGQSAWDVVSWDQFFWDGQTLMPAEADLECDGENISLTFSGNSDEFQPFTLAGAMVSYTPRRSMR